MCGIIGYIGSKQVVPILIDGLRRLEYRGYDSAGVAVVRDGAIELRRSAGKLSQARRGARDPAARGRLRHRPHPLGDARPADRGERPPASRLHRPHRRRAQRHHRELPRSEAAAAEARGTPSSPRPTPRSSRTSSSARCRTTGSRTRCGARCLHARAVRAGADLGRRSRQDRHRAQRPADRRRPRRRRVLRRVRHPGDPQPHPRRRVPRRRGDGRSSRRRASSSPTTRAARCRRRARAWPGIRSWRRRPATSTSCSRRSSSSRGRCGRPCSAARRSRPAQVFLQEIEIPDQALRADRARRDSRVRHVVARGAGRQVPDRVARPAAGRSRLRLGVPLPRSDRRRRTRWRS